MKNVIEHYNQLIDENNDPVHDPKPLREYMDKWDGKKFIDSMQLDKSKSVLEIGVGTGRLARKVAPNCNRLVGIDISPKTIDRATENLSSYLNVALVCGDFMSFEFEEQFDIIYSSLTFMHIREKAFAIQKIASLLKTDGLFVLSIDKNQSDFIDMGTRQIKIYPDNPSDVCHFIANANLELTDQFETDNAHVIVSKKTASV